MFSERNAIFFSLCRWQSCRVILKAAFTVRAGSKTLYAICIQANRFLCARIDCILRIRNAAKAPFLPFLFFLFFFLSSTRTAVSSITKADSFPLPFEPKVKSGRGKEKMEADAKVLAVMEVGVAAKLLARSTNIIFCSFMNYSQTH